jgi:poly-beta-hydroxyalkanoate depolymerase
MANEKNLKPFKKGEVANPNGRPKKYVTLLKESGYKLSEVNDTIQAMMAMTIDELKQVFDNPLSTILEKTVAGAMVKSLKNGSLYSLDTLMTRVYGKPKETAEINVSNEYKVTLNLK